jgi:hypothetical protein
MRKKADPPEAFLNSVARTVGHIAGSVAKATHELVAQSSGVLPTSLAKTETRRKRGKSATQMRQAKKVAAHPRRKSSKKTTGAHRQTPKKKR